MKRKLMGALALMVVALAVNADAQSKARAAVPFDFVIADKVLPAATYDIFDVATSAIKVRDFKNGNAVMALSQPADGNVMHDKLVFHKYGGRYFLYQVWSADGQGIQLRESKLEYEERASARSETSAPQEVILALR